MAVVDFDRMPSEREMAWFGGVVAVFFGIVGGIVLWRSGSATAARALWGTGLGLALLYYLVPPLRMPLYLGWMRAVMPLGWVISHAILALIFYGIFTPMGIVMRLFGRDRMEGRFEPEAESYWIEHEPADETSRYFKQS